MTTGLASLTHSRFDASEQHPDVGPCILYSDGYLTIDLGPWHFHLCVGPHSGSPSPELRKKRPVAKVAFFERRGKGCGGEDQKLLREPDWSRLDVYYRLRAMFLEAMPANLEAIVSSRGLRSIMREEGDECFA